jgi:dipeptidyl aminopeptidase/acylaminoacyl peptidase
MADQFEARLDQLFLDYAAQGVRTVDRFAIASGAIASGTRTHWRSLRVASPWRLYVAILVSLALVAAAVALIGGQLNTPKPVLPTPVSSQATPTSEAVAPFQNGPMAVLGQGGIVLIDLDGTQTPLVIKGTHGRSCPTFSPDGRTLAYLEGALGRPFEQLAVIDRSGHSFAALWTGEFNNQIFHQVVWSADGRSVAATGAIDAAHPTGELVLGHLDGSPATLLPWAAGELPGEIAWSPDGTQFALTEDGVSLEVRDIATGALRIIARSGQIRDLAWSPDGQILAYAAAAVRDGIANLRFVNADGSGDRLIDTGVSGVGLGFMAWSRDGSTLAVLSRDGNFNSGTVGVRLYDASGHPVGGLGPWAPSDNLSFTWAPDGRSLVLTTSGKAGVFGEAPLVASLDGGTRTIDPPSGYYTQCPIGWARL